MLPNPIQPMRTHYGCHIIPLKTPLAPVEGCFLKTIYYAHVHGVGGVVQGLHHNDVLKRRVGLYHTTSYSPLNSQPTSPTNEHTYEQNCFIHKKLFVFNSQMVSPSKSKLLKRLVGIHT